MKQTAIFLAAALVVTSCIYDLQNPSDPATESYSVSSKATVHLVTSGVIRVGDTVFFKGGVTSKTVEKANLISRYQWDFNGDGTDDTATTASGEAGFIYKRVGTYTCRVICTDRARYRDTATVDVPVRPASWGLTVNLIIRIGDTLRVIVNRDTTFKVVSKKGDTVVVIPGLTDRAISVVNLSGDTLHIPLLAQNTAVMIYNPVDTIAPPPGPIYLPQFPSLPGFPDSVVGDCAFFAADSSLMHTNLNFYNILWEQTKTDGFEAIEFVEKLITDVAGYSVITLIGGDYSYTFTDGVYSFSSGDFKISCAFHYGSGVGNHAEDDTVRAELFSLGSYIGGFKTTQSPPFYTFTPGPLFELIDGEVSIDQSLNVSFSVDFSRLKISFFRKAVNEFSSLPFFVVNDSLRLQTTYTSYARMAPVYMLQFSERFHSDSIKIDHSGTAMASEPELLDVVFRTGDTYLKTTYSFTVKQVMDSQLTSYGNRDGILKLSGGYTATATLGFNGFDQSVYFAGCYSSTVNDSSWFYCDLERAGEFGTLFFGEIADSIGLFTSEPYGYTFEYVPQKVQLSTYRSLSR